MPGLYVITGSNGSGKSSLGSLYLPAFIRDKYSVFDGDKLFIQKRKELYPSETQSVKEAGRMANEWLSVYFSELVTEALDQNDHFVYEGHFVNQETWEIPEKFRKAGYIISVLFFGLKDVELSALRVFERAIRGGHNVPPYEIEINFFGNLRMLNKQYRLIDDLKIVDTSAAEHHVLAVFANGEVVNSIPPDQLPRWFIEGLPTLYQKILQQEK